MDTASGVWSEHGLTPLHRARSTCKEVWHGPADTLMVNGSSMSEANSASLAAVCATVFDQQGVSWVQIQLRWLKIAPWKACGLCVGGNVRYCADKLRHAARWTSKGLQRCRPSGRSPRPHWFNVTAQLKTFIDRLHGLCKLGYCLPGLQGDAERRWCTRTSKPARNPAASMHCRPSSTCSA